MRDGTVAAAAGGAGGLARPASTCGRCTPTFSRQWSQGPHSLTHPPRRTPPSTPAQTQLALSRCSGLTAGGGARGMLEVRPSGTSTTSPSNHSSSPSEPPSAGVSGGCGCLGGLVVVCARACARVRVRARMAGGGCGTDTDACIGVGGKALAGVRAGCDTAALQSPRAVPRSTPMSCGGVTPPARCQPPT